MLTNFSNDKQIQKNLKSNFPKTIFQKTNITLKIIKLIISAFQGMFCLMSNTIFKLEVSSNLSS